ncbi:alpha/beta hydrolase family protein [Microbacterium pygmaeum]|nr:alpha/beta hydrolase [Microbacterium pygmaeum]
MATAIGGLAALGAVAVGIITMLARRIVGVRPRRQTLIVRRVGDDIELTQTDLTLAEGSYGLWFGERFAQHALIGPVLSSDGRRVIRRLLETTVPMSSEPFAAKWTGHTMSGPCEIDPNWEDVVVPLRDGESAPAWLFRGTAVDKAWVIHVQGIRTSRLVTLRSVEVAHQAGLTSMVITYRGSGDGPPVSASTLGQREWSDLADAIAYARSHGATAVYVVAWSMGAGLSLELLRREPAAIDRLALISPATQWRPIIQHGVHRAGLPATAASLVMWALGSRVISRLVGMPEALDFNTLNWVHNLALGVPTILVHSDGDQEIPIALTTRFLAAHPRVTLVKTAPAPHGWEANVDPDLFRSAVLSWLVGAAHRNVESP